MNETSQTPTSKGSKPRHAAKHCRRRRIWIPILAVFLFQEIPTVLQLLGGGLILAGLYGYAKLEN